MIPSCLLPDLKQHLSDEKGFSEEKVDLTKTTVLKSKSVAWKNRLIKAHGKSRCINKEFEQSISSYHDGPGLVLFCAHSRFLRSFHERRMARLQTNGTPHMVPCKICTSIS